jgi:hypothetical protein
MEQTINGYKYLTEEEAIAARKQCADYYGLPKSQDDTTLYWVDYSEGTFEDVIFWYISFDSSIQDILGLPQEFLVEQENQ